MWANELYERERHDDLILEAEHQREILSALDKAGRKPLSKQILAALGAKLVKVGTRLQDNVETASTAPMVTATKRA